MFRKAERKRAKLRLALYGITNSGKSYAALAIATGMGGKIAVIDTESGRGDLHAGKFDYDIMRLDAPFHPSKYVNAIKKAEEAGYDILIIDSLSHAWSGEGGVLSVVDQSGNNKFGGWKDATPLHNSLIDTITQSKMHIIVTMRAKTEWALELNEKGKHAPRKVGLGFVQRDGVDYEFTVVMQMSPEKNMAFVEKDNTENYNQQSIKPSPEMGKKFIAWLNEGTVDKDKEEFIEHLLPDILQEIHLAESLEELETAFVTYKGYAKKYPDEFIQIIEAKDQRKIDLKSVIKENTIPSVIPNQKNNSLLQRGV